MDPNQQWPQETAYVNQGNGHTVADGYSETIPINDMPQTNYTEDQVVSVAVAAEVANSVRQLTHLTGERDHHLPFILRHWQQVKALTSGNFHVQFM